MAKTNNGDTEIWYEVTGEGPPLVMVYGIGGNSRGWWDEFPDLLRKRYTVIMLDNRGTGRSGKPEVAWGMSEMTGDIGAVADAAGLGTFHLLGCSLGTILARQFVRERGGSRLRSLTLICPPNGTSATEEDMNAALWWDRNKDAIDNARKSWPIIHPEPWIAANEETLTARFLASMEEPTPPRTFTFQMNAAQSAPEANSALNDYQWPVLIAHGAADRLVPVENARTLKAAVPRARLEIFPGGSHNLWCHDAEGTARVVLDFLDRAEAQGGGK